MYMKVSSHNPTSASILISADGLHDVFLYFVKGICLYQLAKEAQLISPHLSLFHCPGCHKVKPLLLEMKFEHLECLHEHGIEAVSVLGISFGARQKDTLTG